MVTPMHRHLGTARGAAVLFMLLGMNACAQESPVEREVVVERALEALTRHLDEEPAISSQEAEAPSSRPSNGKGASSMSATDREAEAWIAGCKQKRTPYYRLHWSVGGGDIPVRSARYQLIGAKGEVITEGTTTDCGDTRMLDEDAGQVVSVEILD